MLVKELMNKRVITISPDDFLVDAIRKMSDNNIGCLIVTKNDKAIGILTERDVVNCLAQKNNNYKQTIDETKVSDIMTRYIISVSPNTKIENAIKVIKENKIKKLPVLDDSTKIVGIITITDICLAEPKIIEKLLEFISKE
jgi:acetoin utilization protein AcuB